MLKTRWAGWLRAIDSSFLWGLVATAAFYAVVLLLPSMRGSLLERYTTEHAVEYVIVTFFMWGLMDVALKAVNFPRELMALRHEWLPARQGRDSTAQATVWWNNIRQQPAWLQESKVGRRLSLALGFITEKGSDDEYREHLQRLSEQDEDLTHANYSVIRFVMGASPVLGFLGTVIHFGTALSGNSLDDLADRLPAVVSEMGAAFNTTTVALASAMTMMFSLFVCERLERGIVHSIDRLVERELLNRFDLKDPSIQPFLAALQSAHQESVNAIGKTVNGQLEQWTQGLEFLFQRFDQRQQTEVQTWQGALDVLQQRHETYDSSREERLRQSLALVDRKQDKHLDHIQATLEKAVALRDDFGMLAKTLDSIAQGEGKLVEQQRILTDNLRVLRETQQIDEALHGLTAAIHLLTSRHGTFGREAA